MKSPSLAAAVPLLLAGASSVTAWTYPVIPNKITTTLGENLKTVGPTANKTYDYIIIGSGAGGAPLAARLAMAKYSVLVIEAGEDHGEDVLMNVPAGHVVASEYQDIEWDFFVEHYTNETQAKRDSKYTYRVSEDEYYVGLDPPAGAEPVGILYPRVAALGGCTEHNAMITVVPQDEDWERIAARTGDDSWSASKMRGYWERIERCEYLEGDISPGHGFDGWLTTTLTPTVLIAEDLKVASLILGAAAAVGKNIVSSILSTATGLLSILALDINTADRSRDTTNQIYQIPMAVRPNNFTRSTPRHFLVGVYQATNPDGSKKYPLDIAMNTFATKINFDLSGASSTSHSPAAPRATSVDYLHGKSLYKADPRSAKSAGKAVSGTVFARKEIIVSGGTFNTPQLLKLSGVGPRSELERFDIPVVVDLPAVGSNMQDRYEVAMVAQAPTKLALLADCTFFNGPDPCYDKWVNPANQGFEKGGYTTNGLAYAFLNHSSVDSFVGPDLYLGAVPSDFYGYFPGYGDKAVSNLAAWSFYTLKGHSHNNAGTVNLTSANPLDTPRIVFRSFFEGVGGEADLQAMWEGLQYQFRALADQPNLDGKFTRFWPSPETVNTEAEWKQWILDEAWGHHAACSCPIGTDDDPTAVVDSRFRVRGVQGLRVVDASVFREIPGFFMAPAVYMISEKAADVIIADAKTTQV